MCILKDSLSYLCDCKRLVQKLQRRFRKLHQITGLGVQEYAVMNVIKAIHFLKLELIILLQNEKEIKKSKFVQIEVFFQCFSTF